jgi:hypothetical protein
MMAAVARMSEATSGRYSATGPGYRFAHPGYELPFSRPKVANYRAKTRLPVFIQRVNFPSEKTDQSGSETWPNQRAKEACRKR